MRQIVKQLMLLSVLLLPVNAVHADPLFYEFATVLTLESGTDTVGLEGAQVTFNAEIPQGTVFRSDDFGIGILLYDAAPAKWGISGSSSVDGNYALPNGATYAGSFWWDFGGFPFNIAPFENLVLAHAPSVNPGIGDIVGPEHFGRFPSDTLRPDLAVWRTTDGSIYNWADNARYSLSRVVSIPTTLALMSVGLPLIFWSKGRRRIYRSSCT
ncbi:MAG: hypothetical protein R3E54_15315 [Halioglobus sp.]